MHENETIWQTGWQATGTDGTETIRRQVGEPTPNQLGPGVCDDRVGTLRSDRIDLEDSLTTRPGKVL